MTREEFLQTGLLEQYVLGITSPEENDLVQQMLKQYPELDNDCKGLMDCMEKYARANAITPPAGLKASILGKINELDEEAPTGKEGIVASPTITKSGIFIPTWGAIAVAAGFVGILFTSFFVWNEKTRTEAEMGMLATKFENFQKDCEALENERKLYAAQNVFLKDTKTIHVHLRGTANSPDALAVVFWNETKDNAYLKLVNLPKPPTGKTYQLWADIDSKMVNMGTFNCEYEKLIDIPYMANAASLNVTLEDGNGADHPNVEQLMMNGLI